MVMSEVKAVEVLNECLGKEFPDDPVSAIKAQRAALVALAALRDEVADLQADISDLRMDRVQMRAARLEADNARLRERLMAMTFAHDDGAEYEHDHGEWEGHNECPACWADDIRAALAEKEGGHG